MSATKRMVWSCFCAKSWCFSLPDLFLLICGNSMSWVSLVPFRMTNTFPSFHFPATALSTDFSCRATVLPCPISPYSHLETVCVVKDVVQGIPERWREENALGAVPLSKGKWLTLWISFILPFPSSVTSDRNSNLIKYKSSSSYS